MRRRLQSVPGGWPARALIGALVAVLVIQLVRLLFAIVTPAAPLGDWRPRAPEDMAAAAKAQLFARVDPFYRNLPTGEGASNAVTALQIGLFGIRMNMGSAAGSAIIAGTDGIQNSIGVGEEIQPGVRLVAVHFDHVEIDNSGKRELLYIDQADAPGGANAVAAAGSTGSAPMATNAALSGAIPLSPQSLRAGISFSPRSESGRVTGIALGQQGDGSAFQAAGFRNGDVIRAINGRPVTSASDAAGIAAQLQPGVRLSLDVERGAGTVPIAIIIPNGNP